MRYELEYNGKKVYGFFDEEADKDKDITDIVNWCFEWVNEGEAGLTKVVEVDIRQDLLDDVLDMMIAEMEYDAAQNNSSEAEAQAQASHMAAYYSAGLGNG